MMKLFRLEDLYVLGTERHESRRIDNQLRGRSGRQGDPGLSRFFVALEDDLMRIFGGEQISNLMTFFKFPEDQPLTHSMVSKAIEQAQVKVEGFNFDIRKHLVDYDDVLNKQRDIIYSLRRKTLSLPDKDPKEFRSTILDVFQDEMNNLVNAFMLPETSLSEDDIKNFHKEINFIVSVGLEEVKNYSKKKNLNSFLNYLMGRVEKEFQTKEKRLGERMWNEIVRIIFLSTIDKYWTDHLTSIEDLREGINLRGYAQLDPLVEYKNEAYSMFEKMVGDVNFEATRRLFKVEVEQAKPLPELERKDQPMMFKSASSVDPFTRANFDKQNLNGLTQAVNQQQSSPPSQQHLPTSQQPVQQQVTDQNQNSSSQIGFRVIPPGQSHKKPGRNDPCWCGSGKKYKRCHYPN